MTLAAKLLVCQQRVDQLLNKKLPKADNPHEPAAQAMRYVCLNGGKRLRPFLAYLVADLFGKEWLDVDFIATAIEMIHCYSLVHDDLPAMDNDNLRRGLPTCHRRFDEATAILAGDALLTLAFAELSHKNACPDKALQCKIIHLIAQKAGSQGMVKGQILDLSAEQPHFNEDQLIAMHNAKTGALIEAVVQSAAWICGANDRESNTLTQYARHIGLAFQVVDDILDTIGNTQQMGKQAGQDHHNNMCTFVTLLGVAKAQDFAKQTVDHALTALMNCPGDTHLLEALAQYILKRNS